MNMHNVSSLFRGARIRVAASLAVTAALSLVAGGSAHATVLASTARIGTANGHDVVTDMAIDGAGNVTLVGYTDGFGFPVTTGAAQGTVRGAVDAFVAKYNASGALVYATFFGGSGDDNARAVALDAGGRAYVVGDTVSTDLTIRNGFQTAAGGRSKAFLLVLAADGKSIAYSSYLGGVSTTDKLKVWDVATSTSGEMWLAGETTVASFPFAPNGFQRALDPGNADGNPDAFVMRVNPAASGVSSVTYFTYYGGPGVDVARKISRSPAGGGMVVEGDSDISGSLPVTKVFGTAPVPTPNPGLRDLFLLKTSGAATFEGAVLLRGDGNQRGGGLAFDSAGNIYFSGETSSNNLPVTPGVTQPQRAEGMNSLRKNSADLFVGKLDPGATTLKYLTYLGGSRNDRAADLAVSGSGMAYVVGTTFSPDFPTTPGAIQRTAPGPREGFLAKLDTAGVRVYSTLLGGALADDATSVVVRGATAWVAGASESTTYPGATSVAGSWDGMLTRLTPSALFVVGSTTLTASDAAIRDRLTGLGFSLTIKAATASTSADADGKELVVVSSTVASTDVGTKFKGSLAGVLSMEDSIQDDMGFTGTAATEFGKTTGQTKLNMLLPGDPLAGGISGTQTVTSVAKTFNWGKPNGNAFKVATLPSDASRVTIYRYEAGAAMVGATAAARRVGFFLWEDTAVSLTLNGWPLFDLAARWAAGQ